MANHRSDETYVPLKTVTVAAWFFGLFAAIVVGMSVGDKISVFPSPLFDPFPVAQMPEMPEWLGGTTAPIEPDVEEVIPAEVPEEAPVAEPVVQVISSTVPVAAPLPSASQPVRTPVVETRDIHVPNEKVAPVETPAPVVETPIVTVPEPVVEEPVIPTPDPVVEEPIVEDVQPQLPEEVIGRQIEGSNGEDCTVLDVEGNTSCVIPETEELVVG